MSLEEIIYNNAYLTDEEIVSVSFTFFLLIFILPKNIFFLAGGWGLKILSTEIHKR